MIGNVSYLAHFSHILSLFCSPFPWRQVAHGRKYRPRASLENRSISTVWPREEFQLCLRERESRGKEKGNPRKQAKKQKTNWQSSEFRQQDYSSSIRRCRWTCCCLRRKTGAGPTVLTAPGGPILPPGSPSPCRWWARGSEFSSFWGHSFFDRFFGRLLPYFVWMLLNVYLAAHGFLFLGLWT